MKVITLTGLKQVDELSTGSKCTPVEDATMSGGKVIRCKEDVVELDAAAPPMVATLSGVAKKHRKRKARPADESCVPKWVAMRSKHGKTVKRCHCRGRFLKSETCGRGK